MTATRILLILLLLAVSVSAMPAQEATATTTAEETTTASEKTAETSTAASEEAAKPERRNPYTTRDQFTGVLRGSPSELATIVSLDPTLLSNEGFLSGYPELAKFVAENPEVRRNPRFYLAEFPDPTVRRSTAMDEVLEGLIVLGTMTLIAFALAWLVRTVIEQKRWNRLSRTQSEVHNKILDRFSTSEELLAYVRSPAGTRFLESAPIPLHAEKQTQQAPFARMIWSIQLGVVVVAGALGMLVVSGRFDADSAQGFFAMGVIALCVGLGFIGSAIVSIVLPRRLGIWQNQAVPPASAFEDSGSVR
jgi:hypothetical protein